MKPIRSDLVAIYLLITPAFVIADLGFGLPVRVAGLPEPGQRLVYYFVVFALGVLCYLRPRVSPFVGMLESVSNLTLLFVSILLPIWSLPDAFLSGAPLEGGLEGLALGNAVLSGTALIVSFHRSRAAVARLLGGGPDGHRRSGGRDTFGTPR